MGGYIHMDKDLVEDPRLLDLADIVANAFEVTIEAENDLSDGDTRFSSRDVTELWSNALLGALTRLWTYADVHIRSDDTLPIGVTALSQVMRLPAWIIKLYPSEWLQVLEESDTVKLPNYCEKNNITAKDERRAKPGKQRTREWRERRKKQRLNGDTHPSPRSHRDAPPVPVPGPVPSHTGTGTDATTRASLSVTPAAPATRKSFEEDFADRYGSPPTVRS